MDRHRGRARLQRRHGFGRAVRYHRAMTWRTRRMMRRSRPRVNESRVLAGSVSILWTAVAIAAVIMLAVGLFYDLPGTNAIDNPVVVVP